MKVDSWKNFRIGDEVICKNGLRWHISRIFYDKNYKFYYARMIGRSKTTLLRLDNVKPLAWSKITI